MDRNPSERLKQRQKHRKLWLLLPLLLLVSPISSATLYKCVDERGRVEFQSLPCQERDGVELDVGKEERLQTYDVYGLSTPELHTYMVAHSPDPPYYGHTSSDLRWDFRFLESVNECRMTGVNVNLNVVVKVPRWHDYDRADSELKALWDRFYDALLAHEREHSRIAQQVAQSLRRELNALGARPKCSTLEAEANEMTFQATQRLERQQALYDRESKHGKNEGVTLSNPP